MSGVSRRSGRRRGGSGVLTALIRRADVICDSSSPLVSKGESLAARLAALLELSPRFLRLHRMSV